MALYELLSEPELDSPVLLVAVEGWIDAGGAAARAVEVLLETSESTTVATFDTDQLLDFRARRPTMHLAGGVNTGLTWSTIELRALRAPNGTDLLVLTGAEPDHAWISFADAVVALAQRFGCRMQVGFGAYPAGVPHTRPVQLSATTSTEELAESLGLIRGDIDVPAGIEAVLERRFHDLGVPAAGIWAQVPHYISAMRYPAAAARLIEELNRVTGSDFAVGDLVDEAGAMRERLDALVHGNPQHVAMLRQLEESFDAQTEARFDDLPSGDDLAEELQRFLREQGD